jgi:phosphohistidine phosphatase
MYLYLVRHGEALSKEEDPEQGLSGDGRDSIRKISAFTKGLGIKVKQVFHSGKKRAMQTGLIFMESIQSERGLLETDGLAPMDDPAIWHERISRLNEDVMLVGHLPHLAKVSSMMLCSGMEAKTLDFDAGSIACLKRSDDNTWAVDWMMKPGLIQ